MKFFDLEGKTALITGGGRGIGKAIALALAEAGANIVVTSRTEKELKQVCEEADSEFGQEAFYYTADIEDEKSIKNLLAFVIQKKGKIDILVNGAGNNVRNDLINLEDDDWERIMKVNLKSVYLMTKNVIPYMQKQKAGKIINIASLNSEISLPNMAVYAASKGGVTQLTKSIAVDYAVDGINSNAIGPGYFKTEMTKPLFEDEDKVTWMKSRIPLNRIGEMEDLKGTAVFLASKASDYITGQTIYVDGGWLIS